MSKADEQMVAELVGGVCTPRGSDEQFDDIDVISSDGKLISVKSPRIVRTKVFLESHVQFLDGRWEPSWLWTGHADNLVWVFPNSTKMYYGYKPTIQKNCASLKPQELSLKTQEAQSKINHPHRNALVYRYPVSWLAELEPKDIVEWLR